MADCKKCKHNYKPLSCEPKCNRMCDGESDFEPQTNADRIRNMSDEELAEWILNIAQDYDEDEEPIVSIYDLDTGKEIVLHDSYGDVIKWLQAEAKEGASDGEKM